jgi:hypothetical protein
MSPTLRKIRLLGKQGDVEYGVNAYGWVFYRYPGESWQPVAH